MPRSVQYTREEIVSAAFKLIRENGAENLSARTLSKALGCSTTPLFTAFKNIEEIRQAVKEIALAEFTEYVKESLNYIPAFKEYGMRMIRYAENETNLYRFLFMNKEATRQPIDSVLIECLASLKEEAQLTEDELRFVATQVRMYVTGIIYLIVTGAESFTEEQLNRLIGAEFVSTMMLVKSKHPLAVHTPRPRQAGEGTTLPIPDLPSQPL